MLIYRRTSILESTAQTLTNTVNCVGVMGKGLAQAFKERDPDMYNAYRDICDRGLFEPGKLWLWKSVDNWILNFATKKHWRNPSKIEWIEDGLKRFCAEYERRGIREISFPRLGCGNGNLNWDDVRPLMEHYLLDLPIPIYIHDFSVDIDVPEHLAEVSDALEPKSDIRSFDSFMNRMGKLISLTGDRLVDLNTKEQFSAKIIDEDQFEICSPDGGWKVNTEDFRDIWLYAQESLVTSSVIDHSISVSGAPLISLISALPDFRAIQIQHARSKDSEIALEVSPRYRTSVATSVKPEQRELLWQ